MDSVTNRLNHRGRRSWLAMIGALLVAAGPVLVPAGPAAAAGEDAQINLVLDISGSMKEPAEAGVTKIAAAQSAIRTAVEGLPAESELGLRTFGGCGKSTQVVPIGRLDRAKVISAVDAVQPDGDTPLAYAMEQGGKDFKDGGERSMIVVSDGEETCQGDPVAAARKLANNCVDVHVDVIGFKVDEKTRQQLAQVAAAGCGKYYDIDDAGALAKQLRRASVRALRPVPTIGTPVTGTDTPTPAPVLKPGTYKDVMSNTPESLRYWAFELPEGATAYVSVTFPGSRPADADYSFDAVWLTIFSGTDDPARANWGECSGSALVSEGSSGGATTMAGSAQTSTGYDFILTKDEICNQPGRRWIEVRRPTRSASEREQARQAGIVDGLVPVEITVQLEPKAVNPAVLPPLIEDDEAVKALPAITVAGPAKPVLGGGAFGDAPVIAPGVYSDTLRAGEALYYRVPVNWGQQLAVRYRLTVPARSYRPSTELNIYSPYRQEAYISGAPFNDADGHQIRYSPTVRYNNRLNASGSSRVNAADIPGYYYVQANVLPATTIDQETEFGVELDIAVVGEVTGAPDYEDTPGTTDPAVALKSDPSSKDGLVGGGNAARAADATSFVKLAALGVAGVCLLAAIAGVIVLLRLRRRRHT